MASTFDILRKTISNSNLSDANKETYLKQLNKSTETETNTSSTARSIISNPVINTTMANLGFNPSAIMRDTYKPGFSFKSDGPIVSQSQTQPVIEKPVNKKNQKNAVIITKEQKTGINDKGKPEIIASSIQIVQKAKKYNNINDKKVPIDQNQAYKYSDETPLLDEKIVNPTIPFSKKLSP